jgi:hypothetical protein
MQTIIRCMHTLSLAFLITHANQSAEIKYLHVFVFVLLYNYIKNVECIPSQWIYNDVLGPASWTFSPLDSPNYHKNNRQD